jgi:FSR family fosmidomycin resistance protein-like MFS transporter
VTVFIGVGIAGNLAGGHLNDRVGKGVVLYGTSVLAVLSLAGFALLQGAWIWPVLAVMGVAVFGSSSTTMLIGQDIFRENPALGSGVALGLANGLGAILAIPVTYAASRFGDPTAAWILLALTVLTVPAVRGMPLSAEAAAATT